MNAKRKIEIFSAGCFACKETIGLIKKNACPSCEVSVLDINDKDIERRAKNLEIHSVPSVVIDGKLADCCKESGPAEAVLKTSGLGQTI